MTCTRCGNYTLFPPLCAQCEKDEQRLRDRAERPAKPEESPTDVLKVAAKEFGMSVDALSTKLKKGNVSYTYDAKVTVTRSGGSDSAAESRRALNYDALLRIAHSRETNAARVRMVVKALIFLTVLYWGVRPLARWLLQ